VPGPIDLVVANLPYLPAADAWRYPDLVEEPADAVFAGEDGLEPYRRLVAACAERLAGKASVVIQLHRRVHAVTVAELPVLRARLELSVPAFALVPRLAAVV
jgi:release factor glutamine methyltransferase